MASDKVRVVVVSGPTASGKSELAIALARRFNGEIISADSRQVYAGMDLGTGKVSKSIPKLKVKSAKFKVRRNGDFYSDGVRHWMLDIADPKRQYPVAHFKRDAQKAIQDIVRRGKLPIICGGTGFWIDALVYDLSLPAVKPDAKLRAKLGKLSTVQLFTRLQKLDSARATTIDRHNPVRLIRALEIVLATGQPVPPVIRNSPYDILYLGISLPMAKLKVRIKKRLDARLKHGMLAEVRRLHESGVSWKRLEAFGLEYRWVSRYLQKQIPRAHMHDGLLRDIIAYAKRQLTWWRKNPDVIGITDAAHAGSLVNKFLKSA